MFPYNFKKIQNVLHQNTQNFLSWSMLENVCDSDSTESFWVKIWIISSNAPPRYLHLPVFFPVLLLCYARNSYWGQSATLHWTLFTCIHAYTHIVHSAEDHKCLSSDKKELEQLSLILVLYIKKWKEVICKNHKWPRCQIK